MVLEKTSIARKASIQTDSRRKVENFIEPLGARIVSLKKGDQFQVEADRHALKNLDLIYFSSQSPLLLENAQSDFVRIQFHHKGHGTTSIGQKVYNITQRQAVISPANVKVNFNKNFGYKSIRFGQAYLTQKMTALIQTRIQL